MKHPVVYHPKLPGEVREIYEYYCEISAELGEDFWNRLISAIDYAAEFPERHHFDLESKRRRSNLEGFLITSFFGSFPITSELQWCGTTNAQSEHVANEERIG